MGGVGHKSNFSVKKFVRDPGSRFCLLAKHRSALRIPTHTKQFVCSFSHKCKTRLSAGAFVDTLSENWNQLETYIFDAYELIKNANLINAAKEVIA